MVKRAANKSSFPAALSPCATELGAWGLIDVAGAHVGTKMGDLIQ